MKTRSRDNLVLVPLSLFCFLMLLFSGLAWYLGNQENERLQSKGSAIAQQVATSLETFSADRIRAIEDLMITWPEYHPNPIDWFNARAVTMQNVLPGFDDIIWTDRDQNILWNINADERDALKNQPLSNLGMLISLDTSGAFTSAFRQGNRGHYYALIGRAINPYEPRYGYVVASFDLFTTLDVLVGDLDSEQFNLRITDGDTLIMEEGFIDNSYPVVAQPITFAKRQWLLQMQLNQSVFQIGHVVFLLGVVMSVLLCIFLYRQLLNATKLLDSQARYQAASESSLDAITVYQNVLDEQGSLIDFVLVDANKVAREMFPFGKSAGHSEHLKHHGELLGKDIFAQCLKVSETGLPFEQKARIDSDLIAPEWVKLQVVKADSGIAITIRDITQRVQHQKQLKDSEAKFRRLVDGLNAHFVYSQTATGRVTYVSPSITQILGYSTEDFADNHSQYVQKYPDNVEKIRDLLGEGARPEPYVVEYQDIDGNTKLIEYSDSPVLDNDGNLSAIEGIGKDITARMELQRQVYYQANHDQLTGLYNRYAFDRLLKKLLVEVKRRGTDATMCFIDMDQFKLVNDSCGHQAGDQLLRQVASLLQQSLTEQDIVARIGGDEFCLIYRRCNTACARSRLEELLTSIRSFRFLWEDKIFHIGASIGVVEISGDTLNANELVRAADNACYRAKNEGRNRYYIYNFNDQEMNYQQTELERVSQIQQALDKGLYELFYQRIAPLTATETGEHYEILLRMVDGDGGYVSPGVFIPIAEQYGLMTKLDEWVVEHTLQLLEAHPGHISELGKCSINLSGMSLGNDQFLAFVLARLRKSTVPAEKICFEITETVAVTNMGAANQFIDQLSAEGCVFALDDFGAGMSSFTYLKHMPVQYVKIDGSFVKNMCVDKSDYAAVKAIHDIATSMGKLTVAEFVGDENTQRALAELGVSWGQGFWLHEPAPLLPYLAEQPLAANA